MSKGHDSDAPTESTTESGELLARWKANGDERALSRLFRRHGRPLLIWARGRLPHWARRLSDTADVVQDAMMHTFRRLDGFEHRGKGALAAYLRRAVVNRIEDEKRRIARRPIDDLGDDAVALVAPGISPFEHTLNSENEQKYKRALAVLTEEERALVVGRMELGYTYEQLAVMSKRPTPEAARQAVRRALLKLADRMSRG